MRLVDFEDSNEPTVKIEPLEIFSDYPLDWSIKTSAKFLSTSSFDVSNA
jgi:hypothetical protein